MVRDHTLLRFKTASSEERRNFKATLQTIRMKATPTTHAFIREPLEASGLLEHYSAVTGFDYRAENGGLFSCNGWTNLLDLGADVYRELVLEFFSTVRFNDSSEHFGDDRAFTFFLGGERRNCSIVELAWRLGIYTRAETDMPAFRDFMFFSERRVPSGFNEGAFWDTISSVPYVGSRMTEGNIDIPVYRMLHRVITTLLHHSGGPEKVTIRHLYYMYTAVSNEIHLNFPYMIATFLAGQIRGMKEGSSLFGGHLITQLARSYGILDGDILHTLTPIPTRIYDESDFISMRFIERIGETLTVPRDGPAAPAAAAPAPVPPRRRVRHRQGGQQEPDDEIDLSLISRQVGRLDLRMNTHDQQFDWMRQSQEQILHAMHLEPPYPWPVYQGPGPIGPFSQWPYGGGYDGGDGAGPSGGAGGSGA